MMSSAGVTLAGKTAVVTGGKRGIGRGIALMFGQAGANVAICSRGGDELEAVAQQIRQLGGRSLAIRADISRKSDVVEMARRVIAEFGAIDILVNNAGQIGWGQPLLELGEDDWDRIVGTNLKGCLFCSQVIGAEMAKRQAGVIINIASIAAHAAIPGVGAYCVSKAGIVMLTRVLALELAKFNVRVNAISPGWIKTEMNAEIRTDPEAERAITVTIPQGRWGGPEDIARAALFLASDLSDYVTGQTISVDGDLVDTAFLSQGS